MQASYALAVYLFAPLAIIVPLTVSSAVGAHTIIGERERGSGEFLAHSPATERQIYFGKLMASLIPGYFTAAVGFAAYSLVVNLIVGPQLGGWFFPTGNWWILMLWVLPPFIAIALGGDPRDLGAGVERGRRAAVVGARDAAADRDRVRRVERHDLQGTPARVRHRRHRVDRRVPRAVARVARGLSRTPARHGWLKKPEVDGGNVPGVKRRSAVLGLLVAAVLASSASPSLAAAEKAPKRPTDFAVGTTTLKFDNQGRTVTTTVYYPATGRATTLSIEDAPRATKWGPYPLILFSHDLGATPTTYRALLHTWAEAGYVVAVPTYAPPTDAEADENGKVVVDLGERVTDASFVIDRMLDRVQGGFGSIVDRERIAAAGHALGATTTYVLAYAHRRRTIRGYAPRSRSAGSLAGDASRYFTGVDTPLLAIHGDADDDRSRSTDAHEVFALGEPAEVLRDPARRRRRQPVRDRRRSGVAGGRGDHARLLRRLPSRSGERARSSSRATARWPRSRRSRASP